MTLAEAREPLGANAPAIDAGWAGMRTARLTFAAIAAAILLLFHVTPAGLVATWASSSSFHQGFVVAPISLWLIARSAARLGAPAEAPRLWTPALALLAGALFLWLMGRAASVNLVEEAAFVSLLIASALFVFGPYYGRRWAFALGFLFFMVPFGDAILPLLQEIAVAGVMALLKLGGVEASLDGVMITTESGRFEVAEACAGLNFLIAAVMTGALFAHLSFSSARKTAAFIAFAALFALAANILRAFLLVYIATKSEGRIAMGVDHLIFGWGFYCALLFVLVAIGRFFADPPEARSRTMPATARSYSINAVPAGAAALLLLFAAIYGRLVVDRAPEGAAPSFLPLISAPGWRALPPTAEWRAPLSHADRLVQARYQSVLGAVDMNAAYFTHDREGAEIAGGDTRSYDGHDWRRIASRQTALAAFGETRLLRVDTIENTEGARLDTVTLYWLGEKVYADPVQFKMDQMRARLLGRQSRGGAVILASPSDGVSAIKAFLDDAEPLMAWLARIDARLEG